MALVRTTYAQAPQLQFQNITISPATLAAGTLAQRFQTLAFPQKGVKFAGTIGGAAGTATTVPTPPRTTHGAGS